MMPSALSETSIPAGAACIVQLEASSCPVSTRLAVRQLSSVAVTVRGVRLLPEM